MERINKICNNHKGYIVVNKFKERMIAYLMRLSLSETASTWNKKITVEPIMKTFF